MDHACIGVCTYKRPEMLDRLLMTLEKQTTHDCSFGISVIDNDRSESARSIVERHRQDSQVDIRYQVEPEQSISLARNRALRSSEGQYFAGIDDDEFAEETWLGDLVDCARRYAADGVLGPVLPSFEIEPPAWITRGRFFDRESFPTGTVLTDPRQTRSGNFLISRALVRDNTHLFDPKFGLTGGEDSDFFRRMMAKGYLFVWCQEARVYEAVPRARLTRRYLLKRALLRGRAAALQGSLLSFDSAKSLLAILLYTSALPFLLLFRHHVIMRFLIKDCDHLGKILTLCGLRLTTRWSDLAPAQAPSARDSRKLSRNDRG